MKRTFKSLYKRKLVIFLRNYRLAKEKARDLMGTGDINAYLKELVEAEKRRQRATSHIKSL